MSLDIVGVEVRFGGVRALSMVSIRIEPKQILAVIGPNGSGKSTLFNAITGLVPVQGGSITLDGRPIDALPPDQRIRAGLARTFQTPRFDPEVTVRTAVVCGFYPRLHAGLFSGLVHGPATRRDEAEVEREYDALVQSLGLAELSDQSMGELPMGQVRLVEVARAIAVRPKYLLLDEPAAGLSATEQEVLASAIRAAAASGIGVVLIEHNFQLVRNLADHVVVLNRGTHLAEGTGDDIAAHPAVIKLYFGADEEEAA
jgi:ABC-type branched-subunit amino acid transport system ATPase component